MDFAGLDLGPVAVHRSRSFPRRPSRPPHSTHTAMYFVPQNEGREDRKSLEKSPSLGASETDSEMAPAGCRGPGYRRDRRSPGTAPGLRSSTPSHDRTPYPGLRKRTQD